MAGPSSCYSGSLTMRVGSDSSTMRRNGTRPDPGCKDQLLHEFPCCAASLQCMSTCPHGFVQVAAALLEYCLVDADASADGAAARQLAGLHIVPLLSGGFAALQPDQAPGGAPRLYLATAVQQRVLAGQAHLLLQCEVKSFPGMPVFAQPFVPLDDICEASEPQHMPCAVICFCQCRLSSLSLQSPLSKHNTFAVTVGACARLPRPARRLESACRPLQPLPRSLCAWSRHRA